MSQVKIFDTEQGYRYIVPRLRAAGIDIDTEKDVILGKSVKSLVELIDNIDKTVKPEKYARYLKAIFHGEAGSGKSFTATNMVIGLMKEKTDLPILLIDSATIPYQNFIRDYMRNCSPPLTYMTKNHWMRAIPRFDAEFLPTVRDCKFNVIMTGRISYIYEDVLNEETKETESKMIGSRAQMTKNAGYEPDLRIEMGQVMKRVNDITDIQIQATVLKDRSNLIMGKSCLSPDWDFFKPVWDYLGSDNIPEIPPQDNQNDLDLVKEIERNEGDKKERDILVEEIKGLFDRSGYGTSVADKKEKAELINTIFCTTSQEKIGQMTFEQLNDAYNRLRQHPTIRKRLAEV